MRFLKLALLCLMFCLSCSSGNSVEKEAPIYGRRVEKNAAETSQDAGSSGNCKTIIQGYFECQIKQTICEVDGGITSQDIFVDCSNKDIKVPWKNQPDPPRKEQL